MVYKLEEFTCQVPRLSEARLHPGGCRSSSCSPPHVGPLTSPTGVCSAHLCAHLPLALLSCLACSCVSNAACACWYSLGVRLADDWETVLATADPVNEQNLNYAPVAVGTVLAGTLITWFLPCGFGARSWFRGAVHNLSPEDPVRPLSFKEKSLIQ